MALDDSRKQAVIRNYFDSWQKHDFPCLKNLFSDNFSYQIDGKESINSLSDLEHYWSRNKKRQKRLSLRYTLIPSEQYEKQSVLFTAIFHDREDKDYAIVTGIITFTFNESGLIVTLWETYLKYNYIRYFTLEWLIEAIVKPTFGNIINIGRKTLKLLLALSYSVIVVVTITSFLFSTFAFLLPELFEQIAFWFFQIRGAEIPENYVSQFLSLNNTSLGLCSIMLAIYSLISIWLSKRKNRPDLIEHRVPTEAEALRTMHQYYARAESVIVFSGDFSFLSKAGPLNNRVYYLLNTNKILMVSFNEKEAVLGEMSKSEAGRRIVNNSNFDQSIYFQSKINKKFSLISIGGRKYILYRYTNDSDKNFIYVIRDIDESRYTIDIISDLAATFRGFER